MVYIHLLQIHGMLVIKAVGGTQTHMSL